MVGSVKGRLLTSVALFLACFFGAAGESQAKITVGTAVPVIAGGTEILVNLDTLIHPVRSAKQAGIKIKGAFKRKPLPDCLTAPPKSPCVIGKGKP